MMKSRSEKFKKNLQGNEYVIYYFERFSTVKEESLQNFT